MLFNISSMFFPELSPSKQRKQPSNLCSKPYNKNICFVLASSATVIVAKKGTNEL